MNETASAAAIDCEYCPCRFDCECPCHAQIPECHVPEHDFAFEILQRLFSMFSGGIVDAAVVDDLRYYGRRQGWVR